MFYQQNRTESRATAWGESITESPVTHRIILCHTIKIIIVTIRCIVPIGNSRYLIRYLQLIVHGCYGHLVFISESIMCMPLLSLILDYLGTCACINLCIRMHA